MTADLTPTMPNVPTSATVLTHDPLRVHVQALDGLRGIAALSVMLYHAWVGNSHGWMAVDFFFCLSGFVLALAYERKLRAGLGFVRYLSWRVMRIYPMLLLGSILGLILWRSGEAAVPYVDATTTSFALAYLAHLLLIPYVGGGKAYPFNNVQWSIFYELLANAVHALLLPILSVRMLVAVVGTSGLFLAIRAFQLTTVNLGFELAHLDIALARTTFSFFLGILLFRLRITLIARLPRVSFWWLAAVLLVLASIHSLDRPFAWLEPLRQIATIEAINPILILLALVSPTRSVVIRWLGVLSFPLYAIHGPLVFFAQRTFDPLFSGAVLKAVVLGSCVPIVGLSLLLGWRVDLPLTKLRRRSFE